MTDNATLKHKERTAQDIFDSFTPEEVELRALIVGSAIENKPLSGDPEVVAKYKALKTEKKYLIDFLVGNILAEEKLKHSDLGLDNFLSHFGVKGMQWGVRKAEVSGPSLARAKVRGGNATLGDAHAAALKSTGHRAINALTGDKTFWKRTAIAAGVAVAVGGAIAAAPLVLPASTLVSVGSLVTGATSVGGYGLVSGSLVSLAEVGTAALAGAGATTGLVGLGAATAGNAVGNLSRAVGGNSRITRSHAALGSTINDRQSAGNERVTKMLIKDGSLSKKDLKQSDLRVGEFLSHHLDTRVKLVEQDI